MSKQSFDYAIVGAGAAGLHLAIQFASDVYFEGKRILIIDKDIKTANDRTWSFWENGQSKWDEIAIKTWNHAVFYSGKAKSDIPLDEYSYKTIRSSEFYRYAKEIIHHSDRFAWIHDEILEISKGQIKGRKSSYDVDHVFDSRIDPAFLQEKDDHVSLIQHFIGWFIETPEPTFNPSEFTIMDYRIRWKDQTSFNYVLPFSSQYALVEFTLFNEYLLNEEDYENVLKKYIAEKLQIEDFTIVEKEIGQIPMSTYPFHRHHLPYLTKIGTAGGWVRPSSGYSFKNAERYSSMIIQNLKKGVTPSKGVATNRFRFYDKIFLGVLKERNDLGEEIFETLYTKQPSVSLFRFLDEESSLLEDVKIMSSLNQPIFRKTLRKSISSR